MSDLHQVVERALAASRADACIVLAEHASSANVRWANTTSTTNGVSETQQLHVISVIGGRVGSVGRSYFPDDDIEDIVRESEVACEGRPEAEDAMPLVDGTAAPDDWDARTPSSGIEVFDAFAGRLAGIFDRARTEGLGLFGYAEHTTTTEFLGTSTGVRRRHTQREGRLEVNAKTPDFERSAWVGRSVADFGSVDLEPMYEKLSRRIAHAEHRVDLEPGRYEVLLEPSCVADMVIDMYWSATRREADEGRTAFSKPGGGNRTGEQMFGDGVSLYSDPAEPGLATTPFQATVASGSYASVFDNGMPLERTDWIERGTLRTLLTPRYWAQRSGGPPAPYIDNLVFPSDGASLDEMIAATTRALLVTCFWYVREVDPQTLLLTGLTRDGVFLVEDGEITAAVNNFRYNMSPIAMLQQTTQIGRTEPALAREWGDYFLLAKMPPLRVEDFNMSSVSQAT